MAFEYRFLAPSDFDSFINLHRSKDKFMNRHLTNDEKAEYLNRLSRNFFESNYKVAGCFENDKLIAVTGGKFFQQQGVFYGHGQCLDLSNQSLAAGNLFFDLWSNFARMTTDHAESLQIYLGYNARELSQGLSFYRYSKRMPLPEAREKWMWGPDRIYQPGDNILDIHQFFFRPYNTVRFPTIVFCTFMKPEERERQVLK
jgi:hypothetical protein